MSIESLDNLSYQVSFEISEELQEIAVALLGEFGFYAFDESDSTLLAYIYKSDFDEKSFADFLAGFPDIFPKNYNLALLEKENWNKKWESNFENVIIDNICEIYPSFSEPEADCELKICIEPKMSFGTGHHATTRLMIKLMSNLDFFEKSVLDVGCGTGILGIYGLKRGAKLTDGIDIDDWCIENSKENAELNQVTFNKLLLGGKSVLPNKKYNFILANINTNAIIDMLQELDSRLKDHGILLISGFYVQDLDRLKTELAKFPNLIQQYIIQYDNWAAMQLVYSAK